MRLADIALARSDHDAAPASDDAALQTFRMIVSVLGEAACLVKQSELAAMGGEKDPARRSIDAAIALFARVGSAGNVAWAKGLRDRLGL